jgi:hypothetical protein
MGLVKFTSTTSLDKIFKDSIKTFTLARPNEISLLLKEESEVIEKINNKCDDILTKLEGMDSKMDELFGEG